MSLTPRVAIVGRPNVGKSTLFNRLVGRRHAIVHNRPGVTRDRITGLARLEGDRTVQVIDTGGLVPGDDSLGLNRQVRLAVEESDLLLLVVDGKEGLLPADEAVWAELRRLGKPAILVVNKADTGLARDRFSEFYRLGVEPQLLVSAEHGLGIGDLRAAVTARLPELPASLPLDAPAIAIVGRPNVGKSSLLNRILGEPRVLVSPQPGTTRDPVDTLVTHEGKDYVLIDTAGIRRRSRTSGTPEELAIMMARRQIERAQLALLVVDAAQGVTTGDLAIAGTIWELGRAAMVVMNKWDLVKPAVRERLEATWPRLQRLLGEPRRVNVSALTGRGVEKIFPAMVATLDAYRTELTTPRVNRLFEEILRSRQPPSRDGRPWKVYYVTQVGTGPPTFMLFANRTLGKGHAFRRFLENRLREALDLPGVPVRLVIRKRGKG